MAPGKKNARRLGAHIVFMDESGFQLCPLVLRTWAPRGKTPLFRHRQRREKVSVVAAVSLSPRRNRTGLYFRFHRTNINTQDVRDFLRYLLLHLKGKIIVLLDNAQIHKGPAVRELLGRVRRLRLEALPAYAPEANPAENVWANAKRTIANGRPDNQDDLLVELARVFLNIQRSHQLLRGFLTNPALGYTPLH